MAVTIPGALYVPSRQAVGPVVANGALWVLLRGSFNASGAIKKSTDGGQTWVDVPVSDPENPSNFISVVGSNLVLHDGKLHFVIGDGNQVPIRVGALDAVTEAVTWSNGFVNDSAQGQRFLSVRSNGDYVVFHRTDVERIMGNDFGRVAYSVWNGSSWTTTVPGFQSGQQVQYVPASVAPVANDGVFLLYTALATGTSQSLQTRLLSSSNTLGDNVSGTTVNFENGRAYPVGGYSRDGDVVAYPTAQNRTIVRRTESGKAASASFVGPTWEADTSNPGAVVYGPDSTLHFFLVRDDNTNIEYVNDQGSNTWTTPVPFATANTQGISAGLINNGSAIGVLFHDNGTVKFDTFVLAPPEPIIEAPTLSLGTVTWDSVTLSWTAAEHANQYEIYRNGSLLTTVSGTAHTDTTVAPSTSYTYVVRGINSEYTGPDSNTVSPTTPDEPITISVAHAPLTLGHTSSAERAPSSATIHHGLVLSHSVDAASTMLPAPSDLTAEALSSSEIALEWDPVAGAAKYEIERDGIVVAEAFP